MIRIPALILAGLLSAPLMEVLSFFWMQIVPLNVDLTANYFVMVVLPMALVLHFLLALLCWKAFEPAPGAGSVIYLGTHMLAQGTMLTVLGNPALDVAFFCLALLTSGSLVLFVFNHYLWCPRCAAPPP